MMVSCHDTLYHTSFKMMLLFLLQEFNEGGHFCKYTILPTLTHKIKLGTIVSPPWFQYIFNESCISSDCES